ncbi:unnamed protein product, partial [Nesidiocoris tenuis]
MGVVLFDPSSGGGVGDRSMGDCDGRMGDGDRGVCDGGDRSGVTGQERLCQGSGVGEGRAKELAIGDSQEGGNGDEFLKNRYINFRIFR